MFLMGSFSKFDSIFLAQVLGLVYFGTHMVGFWLKSTKIARYLVENRFLEVRFISSLDGKP